MQISRPRSVCASSLLCCRLGVFSSTHGGISVQILGNPLQKWESTPPRRFIMNTRLCRIVFAILYAYSTRSADARRIGLLPMQLLFANPVAYHSGSIPRTNRVSWRQGVVVESEIGFVGPAPGETDVLHMHVSPHAAQAAEQVQNILLPDALTRANLTAAVRARLFTPGREGNLSVARHPVEGWRGHLQLRLRDPQVVSWKETPNIASRSHTYREFLNLSH